MESHKINNADGKGNCDNFAVMAMVEQFIYFYSFYDTFLESLTSAYYSQLKSKKVLNRYYLAYY